MLGGGTLADATVTVTDWMGYADTSDVFSVELLAARRRPCRSPAILLRTPRCRRRWPSRSYIATGRDGRPDVDRGVEYAWALSTTEGGRRGSRRRRGARRSSARPYALAVATTPWP